MKFFRTLLATGLLGVAPWMADAAEKAIEKEVVIAASVAQAWNAWTTREGIVGFFAPDARIEPRVGGAFQVFFDPGAAPGRRGRRGPRGEASSGSSPPPRASSRASAVLSRSSSTPAPRLAARAPTTCGTWLC